MSNVVRNNVSKLRIRIPNGSCSFERMAYLQKRLPYGWVVEKSRSTGECYFFNLETGESTYEFPRNKTPRNNTPYYGGSRKKTRRRHRRTMKRKN